MASRPTTRARQSSYLGVLHRQQARMAPESDNGLSAVLVRLSQTTDGDALLAWIHQQTLGRQLPEDASEGALREAAALNRFATKLFNALDRGLNQNATAKRNGN